jgi:hypothetical protein
LLTQYDSYDYDAGSVWVSLHSAVYVPNASHAYDADLRGEVSGGNYARRKLQGREVVFDEATQRVQLSATRVIWPLSTISARWAVLRFAAAADQPSLIGWVDLGATRVTNNASFIIGWENDRILEIEGVAS